MAKKKQGAAKPAVTPGDDLMTAPPQGKGKISIIRRAYKEGAEKGIGFSRTVWSKIWDARALRDFSLKNRQTTKVLILQDPTPMAVHRLINGWMSGSGGNNPFAKKDFIPCASVAFDAEGSLINTGKTCPVCTFLGRTALIAISFPIADIRRQIDKDGNEIPWSVKKMMLTNYTLRDSIMQAIEVAARRENRDDSFAGSVFIVTRGEGRQTSRYGDVWVYEKFVGLNGPTTSEMVKRIPDWKTEWAVPDEDALKEMCRIHMEVGLKHKIEAGDMWDDDGAQELFGAGTGKTGKNADASAEDDLLESPDNKKKGPALSEMDDIDDKDEEEGEDDDLPFPEEDL